MNGRIEQKLILTMTIDESYWTRTFQAGLATSLDAIFGTDTWCRTQTRYAHTLRSNRISRDRPALSHSAWSSGSSLGHIQLLGLSMVPRQANLHASPSRERYLPARRAFVLREFGKTFP